MIRILLNCEVVGAVVEGVVEAEQHDVDDEY